MIIGDQAECPNRLRHSGLWYRICEAPVVPRGQRRWKWDEQNVLAANDLTADGTVAYTRCAFDVLERWLKSYAENCQLTFTDQVTAPLDGAVAAGPTPGSNEVKVLESKAAETC